MLDFLLSLPVALQPCSHVVTLNPTSLQTAGGGHCPQSLWRGHTGGSGIRAVNLSHRSDAMLCRLDMLCHASDHISADGAELHRAEVWHAQPVGSAACICRISAASTDTVTTSTLGLRRAFCSMASGETLLEALQNHEASGVPKDAGTDSAAGFDLVRHS